MSLLEEIRNIKADKGELRKFGITMAVILGLIAGFALWRGKSYYQGLAIAAALFLGAGLLLPCSLKQIFILWMSLAAVMGYFMTRVILGILFYLAVTPIALILKISGKDFLGLKIDKSQTSYWHYRKAKKFDKIDYEKQF